MRGLYIDFEIKRRSKISKLMDYIIVLTLFVLSFTFIVYKPYLDRDIKYNEARIGKEVAYANYIDYYEQIVPFLPATASTAEKSYNKTYQEIEESMIDFSQFISELYVRAGTNDVYIKKWVLKDDNTITIDVSFTVSQGKFDGFQDDVEGLKWVSGVSIQGAVNYTKTVMVIEYD